MYVELFGIKGNYLLIGIILIVSFSCLPSSNLISNKSTNSDLKLDSKIRYSNRGVMHMIYEIKFKSIDNKEMFIHLNKVNIELDEYEPNILFNYIVSENDTTFYILTYYNKNKLEIYKENAKPLIKRKSEITLVFQLLKSKNESSLILDNSVSPHDLIGKTSNLSLYFEDNIGRQDSVLISHQFK